MDTGINIPEWKVFVQDLCAQQFERPQQFAAAFQQQRRVRPSELHQDLWMLPFALLGDGRIDRDAIFQFESAVCDYGLEEVSNLLCGGNFVCDRHVLARSSQLAAGRKGGNHAAAFPSIIIQNVRLGQETEA